MTTFLPARRTTFRNSKDRYIRITEEGCVLSADVPALKRKDNVRYRVEVLGEVRPNPKRFAPLDVEGKFYLADVVTGSLYLGTTLKSNNGHMRLLPATAH